MIRITAARLCSGTSCCHVSRRPISKKKTDRAIFNEMGELDLIGVTLPEEYGCANAGYVAYGLVAREIERCPRSGVIIRWKRRAIIAWACIRVAPTAMRTSARSICRSSPRGEWVGCFGLTEPDAGSDPDGPKTRAEKVADSCRRPGSKMWISNAPIADVFVVGGESAAPLVIRCVASFLRRT